MNVVVTGGTGFVGNSVVNLLCARSDRVTIVTRDPGHARTARVGVHFEGWPPDLGRCDAVVHLAGANVAGRRWNAAYKQEIRSSRVDRTRELVDAIARAERRPRVLVSASAVGYYGDRGEDELDEDSPPGAGFLEETCVAWEAEARRAEQLGVRVVVLRLGVVLGRFGGALAKMVPIFRAGLGGRLGSGRAWFPWVHVNDVAALALFAIDREHVRGPVLAVAPGLVRSGEFTRTLARVLARPALLPVPGFVLRITLGEIAREMLKSLRCTPRRTLELGFRFQHGELEESLRNLLHRNPAPGR